MQTWRAFFSLTLAISIAAPSLAENDALVFYSAGLEKVMPDARDQSLVKALRMLDDRVLELPRETGDQNMPAPAIKFVLDMLLGAMDVRAGMLERPPVDGAPPVYLQWNFHAHAQQTAESMAGRFTGLLTGLAKMPPQMMKPAPNFPGMQMVAEPGGPPVFFGPMKFEGNGGSAFTIAVSKVSASPFSPASINPLKDLEPALAFKLDFQALQPLLEMALSQQQDEEASNALKEQFSLMGVYGPNAMNVSGALGYTKDRAVFAARATNARKALEETKMVSSTLLTLQDLKRIPADATWAQVSRFPIASFGENIRRMSPDEDPMLAIENAIGINPQRDLLDHLGETMGVYASETTGSGGLLSMVGFIEVKNVDALNQTITRLTAMLNQIASQQAKGYVRIAERTYNNQRMHVLTFPGVPVPIEISFTTADGYLYAAASPQSLLAAIAQGRGAKSSLLDNANFKDAVGDRFKNVMKVSFVDSPRLVREGYGLVSLGMAAMHNMVRSPTDPERGADLLMPSLHELAHSAKASIVLQTIEGDDLVIHGTMDRSWLVNASATMGTMGGSVGALAIAGLSTGILLPALGKARATAKNAKSMAQLRQISMAIIVYAADHDDRLPPSLADLVEAGFLTETSLQSPLGPVYEGDDYFINLKTVKKLSEVQHPDRQVLGYDRAMLSATGQTAVVFFDGHVETLDEASFFELLGDDLNKGVDYQLP